MTRDWLTPGRAGTAAVHGDAACSADNYDTERGPAVTDTAPSRAGDHPPPSPPGDRHRLAPTRDVTQRHVTWGATQSTGKARM